MLPIFLDFVLPTDYGSFYFSKILPFHAYFQIFWNILLMHTITCIFIPLFIINIHVCVTVCREGTCMFVFMHTFGLDLFIGILGILRIYFPYNISGQIKKYRFFYLYLLNSTLQVFLYSFIFSCNILSCLLFLFSSKITCLENVCSCVLIPKYTVFKSLPFISIL